MCSLSCHRLPRPPLELGSLMTVHLLWGQLGGHQQRCSAVPGSLKSLKLGLSELTPPPTPIPLEMGNVAILPQEL